MSAFEGFVLDGLDLNNDNPYTLEAADFPPPPKRPQWINNPDVDGDELLDVPRHERRAVTARIRVAKQTTMNLALDKLAAIEDKLQKAERTRGGIPLVWTPAGSTYDYTLYALTGEVTGLPIQPEGEDSGWLVRFPVIELRLDCAPFGYGAEAAAVLTDADPFSSDSLNEWRFDNGSGTISVSGGQLVPSSTTNKVLYRPISVQNGTAYAKFTMGASVTGQQSGVNLRRLDGSNYLRGFFTATQWAIGKLDAGVATNLTNGAFIPSPSTSYWISFDATGNVLTLNIYSTDPNGDTPTAALASATYTLTGADATKFGTGIKGNPGVRWMPSAGLDDRFDDWRVDSTSLESSEPVISAEVRDVPGDVDAEGVIVLTDKASQSRMHAEVGRQTLDGDPSTPSDVLIEKSELTATGLAGTSQTRSGSYGSNVWRATLTNAPVAICATSLANARFSDHIGTWRVKCRCYASGTGPVRVRLAHREGSGAPFTVNGWATALDDTWSEVDLGLISIEEVESGTQLWQGRVEAETDTPGDTLDIDYLILIPAEQYGIARGQTVSSSSGPIAAYDTFLQSAGALPAAAAPLGGNWDESGDTDDFTLSGTPNFNVTRTVVNDADMNTGQYVHLDGSSTIAAVEIQADVTLDWGSSVGLVGTDGIRAGVLARFVDTNNWLAAVIGIEAPETQQYVRVLKRVAGTVSQLGSKYALSGAFVDAARTLKMTVNAAGDVSVFVGTAGAELGDAKITVLADTNLATGGALEDGKVGMYDACKLTSGSLTRTYDNFQASTPVTESASYPACYSGRSIEARHDSAERKSADDNAWEEIPAYRGARFFFPPEGDVDRRSRIVAKMRRADVNDPPFRNAGDPNTNIADSMQLAVRYRPRYLVIPRS